MTQSYGTKICLLNTRNFMQDSVKSDMQVMPPTLHDIPIEKPKINDQDISQLYV